jgi:anti-sigma-K factor RskA
VVKLLSRDPHDLAGVYSLDAVAGAEQDRFERHLATCLPCVDEVRGLRETVSELALAVAAPPPPGFRERVLAAVPSVQQLPPVADRAARPSPAGTAAEPSRRLAGPRSARRRPAHKLQRQRRVGLLPGLALGAAAVATAVALILGFRLTSVENQLGRSNAALGLSKAEQHALIQLLNTPGVRVLAQATRGGQATAVVVPGQKKVVLLAKNLPVLPASKVYQVWLIGPTVNGKPHIRSAGLLAHEPAGGTAILIASGVLKGDTVGITVEPAGGTAQPTMAPFVAIPLVRA